MEVKTTSGDTGRKKQRMIAYVLDRLGICLALLISLQNTISWNAALSATSSSSQTAELPDALSFFFQHVKADGYPALEKSTTRAQPWRRYWNGPRTSSQDGRLLIACPKKLDYGEAPLWIFSESSHADTRGVHRQLDGGGLLKGYGGGAGFRHSQKASFDGWVTGKAEGR